MQRRVPLDLLHVSLKSVALLSLHPAADLQINLGAGLSSQQWGQKKAAATALAALAEAGGDALPPHIPALISTLLQVLCLLLRCQLRQHKLVHWLVWQASHCNPLSYVSAAMRRKTAMTTLSLPTASEK